MVSELRGEESENTEALKNIIFYERHISLDQKTAISARVVRNGDLLEYALPRLKLPGDLGSEVHSLQVEREVISQFFVIEIRSILVGQIIGYSELEIYHTGAYSCLKHMCDEIGRKCATSRSPEEVGAYCTEVAQRSIEQFSALKNEAGISQHFNRHTVKNVLYMSLNPDSAIPVKVHIMRIEPERYRVVDRFVQAPAIQKNVPAPRQVPKVPKLEDLPDNPFTIIP